MHWFDENGDGTVTASWREGRNGGSTYEGYWRVRYSGVGLSEIAYGWFVVGDGRKHASYCEANWWKLSSYSGMVEDG